MQPLVNTYMYISGRKTFTLYLISSIIHSCSVKMPGTDGNTLFQCTLYLVYFGPSVLEERILFYCYIWAPLRLSNFIQIQKYRLEKQKGRLRQSEGYSQNTRTYVNFFPGSFRWISLSEKSLKLHPHEPMFPRQIHPYRIFVKSKLCQFEGKFFRGFFSKWKKTDFCLLQVQSAINFQFQGYSKRKCKLASQFFRAYFA